MSEVRRILDALDKGNVQAANQLLPLVYDELRKLLEGNLAQDAGLSRERAFLRNAHWSRATVLTSLKRYAETVKDLDWAIELDEGPARPGLRLRRALALARAGDHAKAVAEADDLSSNSNTPGGTLYDAACVYGLSMAAAQANADLRGRYASKALALLRRAQTACYFRDAGSVENVQKDDDLAALRARSDFKAFVADLVKQLSPKREVVPAKPP
jgi:hypothetical protein